MAASAMQSVLVFGATSKIRTIHFNQSRIPYNSRQVHRARLLVRDDTGLVEFCCGSGPVIAIITVLSSPEGEICSVRFAVKNVQQARIAFLINAIACQVVCCASFGDSRFFSTSVGVAASVEQSTSKFHMRT